MAPQLSLCLLIALLQQTLCQVIVSSSSSHDSSSVAPPGLPLSSLNPPPKMLGMPTGERAEGGSNRPEAEKDHEEKNRGLEGEQGGQPSAGFEGTHITGPGDESHIRTESRTGDRAPHLASVSTSSPSVNRPVWNVAVSKAFSPASVLDDFISGAGRPQGRYTVHSPPGAATESPEPRRGTSPLAPFLMARASRSSTGTVSPVAGDKRVTTSEVALGLAEEVGEDDLAGSGDGAFAAVSRVESSTLSRSAMGDGVADLQPQAWTASVSTSTPKAPAGSSVTHSSQAESTTTSSPQVESHTTSSDIQSAMPTSATAGKQFTDGNTLLYTTRPKLAESKNVATVKQTPAEGRTVTTGLSTQTSSAPPLQTSHSSGPKLGRAFENNVSNPIGRAFPSPSSPAPSASSRDACVSGRGPCSVPTSTNSTQLLWAELRRMLTFAWDLHVYGTAVLFLLLAAGALVGLLLCPSLRCPYPGCLALTNTLLLLVGIFRSLLFFLDPYGAREILPRTGVTALYNMPLPLLLWAQVSLVLLVLHVAGLWRLLPLSLQRLPLAVVLAVLHCTVLLAADLLSAALSPVVPAVLQTLSLCWGLVLCLGFLLYAFPQTQRCPVPPVGEHAPEAEERAGGPQGARVLGRVLAVCTCLGALCCGLHIHATLWLYGWLGPWRNFSWAWWLVHFWARLLELAWASFMLLLASWVFWRPRGGELGPGEGVICADPPSSSSSCTAAQRHPCWAKIVQSLRGRPCRKSESNGTGEVPNNWASQERPGADISKSLIRNRDQVPGLRSVKDSNRGRNQKDSTGSLMRLQSIGQPPQRSMSSSLDREKEWVREKESVLSLTDFDLRPPSPIDLSRSIDEALHREHLLHGGIFFRPLSPPSPPSSSLGPHHHPLTSWPRRSSDPQINLTEGQNGRTESGPPARDDTAEKQATAPTTPTHQSCAPQQDKSAPSRVPTSISCPVTFRPYRAPIHLLTTAGDDTKPFLTPDSEPEGAAADLSQTTSRGYLEVSRQEDSASVSSDIIDL